MAHYTSTLNRDGEVAIPPDLRLQLGLETGDCVELSVDDGVLHLVPAVKPQTWTERTYGILSPRKRPEDFKELRQMFEDEVAQEVMREAGARTRADTPES
jgi:bifunctional DNA-binding transcriptional regulator/antitoxin component of YhaV-PrlF toxin-antitoxin module